MKTVFFSLSLFSLSKISQYRLHSISSGNALNIKIIFLRNKKCKY